MQTERFTAQQLAIGYRQQHQTTCIARGLSFALHSAELVCLIGPNGAGKSTLLRTLAGLQPALEGEIRIGGKSLPSLAPTQLAQSISVVLSTHQGINLRVRELVEMGRIPHTGWLGKLQTHDHQQVQQALEVTNLQAFSERFFEQLSDGEKQRVMLARALAQDTPIILLDEPTAHLDIPNKLEMMLLLQQLAHQSRKSIIVSSHDLQVALETADRIWLVTAEGGLEMGLPEELILNGAFQRAFAKDGLLFDHETGFFRMHQNVSGKKVKVEAEGIAALWTRKALGRKGFTLVVQDPEWIVTIQTVEEGYRWVLASEGRGSQSFTTLSALCRALESESI